MAKKKKLSEEKLRMCIRELCPLFRKFGYEIFSEATTEVKNAWREKIRKTDLIEKHQRKVLTMTNMFPELFEEVPKKKPRKNEGITILAD